MYFYRFTYIYRFKYSTPPSHPPLFKIDIEYLFLYLFQIVILCWAMPRLRATRLCTVVMDSVNSLGFRGHRSCPSAVPVSSSTALIQTRMKGRRSKTPSNHRLNSRPKSCSTRNQVGFETNVVALEILFFIGLMSVVFVVVVRNLYYVWFVILYKIIYP